MVFLGQDAGESRCALLIQHENEVEYRRKSTAKARRRRFPARDESEDTHVKILPSTRRSPLTMQRHNATVRALRNGGRMRRIGLRLHVHVAVVLLLFGSLVDAQVVPTTSFPTLSPGVVTSSPTGIPVAATLAPVGVPPIVPSSLPTNAPNTDSPTVAPNTISPTDGPTMTPSISMAPTGPPTGGPTDSPTDSPSQFPSISVVPTISTAPSISPTISSHPSQFPTVSSRPSSHPSAKPSLSVSPTASPTHSPSDKPSAEPSATPSTSPTVGVPYFIKENFRQEFVIPGTQFFTATELVTIFTLFGSYTEEFAPEAIRVTTSCVFVEQNIVGRQVVVAQGPGRLRRLRLRRLQMVRVNSMDYFCEYTSRVTDVELYPERFLTYMNSNLPKVTLDMQELFLNVTEVLPATTVQIQTPAPTISRGPTISPSVSPTLSFSPSVGPTDPPSSAPTVSDITSGPTMLERTFPPSVAPVTLTPTMMPTKDDDSSKLNVIVISAVVVFAGLAALVGLFVFYRRRTRRREERLTPARPRKQDRADQPASNWDSVMATPDDVDDDSHNVMAVVSPSESLVTSKSLLSAGSGMGYESGEEPDNTKNLQDEFDQYKDQNLEQLRSDVEGNLTGFEGVMSAAVTRALMGGDMPRVDDSDLMWGGQGPQTGAEIEASALCDVNDWLKRNENATVERRRIFMQEMLNKMVTCVRFGVIEASEASLTIHESAALLGLQLANELPMTTVIISGMRKTVSQSHIIKALREFGEIDVAAVASGQRGFGIVRFRNPKSATLAIRRYRSGEIVVQDVAVQMQVLMPSGTVEGRLSAQARRS